MRMPLQRRFDGTTTAFARLDSYATAAPESYEPATLESYKTAALESYKTAALESYKTAALESYKTAALWRRYPLLYWSALAWIVGLPNFLRFDPTGRTHEFGLFNVTSLSRIGLFVCIACTYIFVILLTAGRVPGRKISWSPLAWLSLVGWCTLASVLQPAGRPGAVLATDLPLSLFRLTEWVLAFCLFATLLRRTPAEDQMKLVVELIGRSSWMLILAVWLALPLWPELVYGTSEDSLASATLGGSFYNSGALAVHSGFAFFYALLFFRRKQLIWLSCVFSVITLVMTRARTPMAGFLLALICFAFYSSRRSSIRIAAVGCCLLFGLTMLAIGDSVADYLLRGQSAENVATLDGRTAVWEASLAAIAERPVLGYGYVAGARQAIRDHWNEQHWVPPHAHNEFLQAMLVGGAPCCALVLYLYLYLLGASLKRSRYGPLHAYVSLIVMQLSVFALIGVNLSVQYSSVGAAFILCFLGIRGHGPPPATYRAVRTCGHLDADGGLAEAMTFRLSRRKDEGPSMQQRTLYAKSAVRSCAAPGSA